jgi:hypothetical protein
VKYFPAFDSWLMMYFSIFGSVTYFNYQSLNEQVSMNLI